MKQDVGADRKSGAKRFYKAASTRALGDGHSVVLDGRAVRTPGGATLVLPTAGLASAIAAEWDAQGATVEPATMPLTRLAATTIDRVMPAPATVADELAAWGGSDLVCYRADSPVSLAERQRLRWQPLVDWARQRHRAALAVTSGVMPVEQPERAVAALRGALHGFDACALMTVHAVTLGTGSLVVALALADGRLTGQEAFEAGALEDLYALEVWGEDAAARRALLALNAEILAAQRFHALSRPDRGSLAGRDGKG